MPTWLLLSAFFWTYAGFQIVSGWMVDRFNVNWVLPGGFFIWSVATAATSLLHGFPDDFGHATLLGNGESVAFPSYSKILAKHFPRTMRGRANAIDRGGHRRGTCVRNIFRCDAHCAVWLAADSLSDWASSASCGCFPWTMWMPAGPGLPVSPHGAKLPAWRKFSNSAPPGVRLAGSFLTIIFPISC